MSAHTQAKATRLLAEGCVRPDIAIPPQVFHVDGDTDRYVVVVGAHVRCCSCAHWRAKMADCAHIEACILRTWAKPDELALMDEAIEVAKDRERAAGEAAFEAL
jgi:hypothetical protein